MISPSTSNKRLPWKRFWSPRETRQFGSNIEFLEDPEGIYAKYLSSSAVSLEKITPETGILVLCGEPGLGKSTELNLLRERISTPAGKQNHLICVSAREFDSFIDFQSHLEGHQAWKSWSESSDNLTILFDGLDEGMIRMPTLTSRLKTFLDDKPTERLRLILTCRSFEWPEEEGNRLASFWSRDEGVSFIFELEPLRREDARLAAEEKGYNGDKFLEAVNHADVASLASRPITLLFLLKEFDGEEFQATSRHQLYKNGCRRLCEEPNAERARLLKCSSLGKCSIDEKVQAAGRLACGLLLGGRQSIYYQTSTDVSEPTGNVCRADDLIASGLLRENVVDEVLGTGLFSPAGRDCFGFAHQTFAECLAGKTLSELPLTQLRTLLCATDPASGVEYVIPQLVELAAWVAGDHAEFFAYLIDVDTGALLRSGVSIATSTQKKRLVGRILELAEKNEFFDESGYWRFWRNLDHPDLHEQLKEVLEVPNPHPMVWRIALEIAEACRCQKLIPTLVTILKSKKGGEYYRRSVAEALCGSLPDTRLSELVPLVKGEIGTDINKEIIGHALLRLVPTYWSVTDALPYVGRTSDKMIGGAYWQALHGLSDHLSDDDILPGLRKIREWEDGFSPSGFHRRLCMAILSRGLNNIDDPEICEELVILWTEKSRNFRDFFRTGDREDADFLKMNDEQRRKWIAAIINSAVSESDDKVSSLSWDTHRLLGPDDFLWLLDNLLNVTDELAPAWAKVIQGMIWKEQTRISWWDEFIEAFRRSPVLQSQMSWFEETLLETPVRRKSKAVWLWRERRFEKLYKRRLAREKRPNPKIEIENAFSRISAGVSWEFRNLCWALSLNEEGYSPGHLRHDITDYSGWSNISDGEKNLVRVAARQYLLDHSDGWDVHGTVTNYSNPGFVAIWLLREEIESEKSLCNAVASKWIAAVLCMWDSSSEHSKELFALAYRINPSRTIKGWIREIRRDSEQLGHPFAIRRAGMCFDETLGMELIELLKILKDPKSVRMAIFELKKLNKRLAGEFVGYLLWRELRCRSFCERKMHELIVAGLSTGARTAWMLSFTIIASRPSFAKKVIISLAHDSDHRDNIISEELTEEELGDFYLLVCRLFPPSDDPQETSGYVTPRRAVTQFRSSILNFLCERITLAACNQLKRLAAVLPDQATWLLYRFHQLLGAFRRNEWQPSELQDIAQIIANDQKRIFRDNSDLMILVLESLNALQLHLRESSLPAVEDLWQWDGAGLKRLNFRNKDEESISDYIARWLRDRIGSNSRVVVNREVQPVRGKRTDIIVEAWSQTVDGRKREEVPLSVTIEVKGCWNSEVKTGAKDQLLNGYLLPFRRTHGIFLVGWFHSPHFKKLKSNLTSELNFETYTDAVSALSDFVSPTKTEGVFIESFLLDCRMR